jgi:hypothetical protein
MMNYEQDINGNPVPVYIGTTLAYTGDKVTSLTVDAGTVGVWVKTLTYTGDNLTGISAWVKQ